MRYCILFFACLLLLSSYSRSQEKIKSEDRYPDARTPWTQVKVNDSEDKFQFIIVSDRTGGMRPGVFQDAVKKIRLLQPDFVVSVGDLIDGYTEDTELLASQWNEFENMIDELNLSFFRVPGNHDISNQKMEQEWIKRYGRTYYYFRYKNVLFLCLNTEDPPPSHISSGQINYVKNVLKNNEDVYHTIILMHRPLWDYADKTGFEKIENLLHSRPYTIFSGHHHNYVKNTKNGNQRYMLATTGGGSYLRGAEVGEFDHMVWVTMKGGRPVTVNLKLDGIISDDIVTEDIFPQVQLLRLGEWFQITPIVHSQSEFNHLESTLIFHNPTDSPLQVSGQFKKTKGISINPSHIKCIIPPDTIIPKVFTLNSEGKQSIPDLEDNPIRITLTGSFSLPGKDISLPVSRKVVMDWIHLSFRIKGLISLDGDLNDWDEKYFITCKNPGYCKEEWAWQGPDDGWFTFATGWDEEYLYLAVRTYDENVLLHSGIIKEIQDKIIIHLSPEIINSSSSLLKIQCAPDKISDKIMTSDNIPQSIIRGSKKSDGFICEAAIPLNVIFNNDTRDSLRLNIAFMDQDRSSNQKPSVLWWRPPWDARQSYSHSGVFKLINIRKN